ncbi:MULTISPECIES: ABC transporter ATP-binding protein [Cytobacillus]|uniref:Sugar ABC transporter ATP-binding protein n=1 Tax=Cytobacillus oceanisediminis 2691 TaxID=1196031 RepID=A0A160MGQ7_9BACI|nr:MULTISPECIES: ATP-binding cassette domain-containing protein [Cytobacillus]MCS0825491.1 ATP-binding cassette domain-containing protein [Cytobacillus firmus]AND42539.1 sugar ABC transporter ATP-binding protein [Cytobacillus oceanisediminis 2691]MBU8730679.1 ATP-binding cassette domain-containing protein [Cytobacillus oceanisediminis]MCM3391782.1 ATP-binding cassette domain-containing protein [Cytobacillus oceanisediminis]UQX53544.1 ATP-binding cassette domain-containing protein [Cytobacillus
MPIIEVEHLMKDFMIAKRETGFLGAVKSLVKREHIKKEAVKDISFSIGEGEMVGYIGPNGAGKSTTIKMLTGILVPSSGSVTVNGIIPYENRQENAKNIGVVFGQRTQLWWDLPTIESFELLKEIYQVSAKRYKENMDTFTEILGLDEFLNTPVRQLSLGQRMRADIAASLLHDPPILFLDEPTIGLDVIAKEKMRTFIKEINNERKITVILTTHDMEDIEKLCERMILIDHGQKVYDGEIAVVKERFGKTRTLIVDLEESSHSLQLKGREVFKEEASRFWIRFNRDEVSASELIAQITETHNIKDLTVEEPAIESIISRIYQEGYQELPETVKV